MKILFKSIFGSNLYGTNLPGSDVDFKGVYIPDAIDFVLGRVPKTSVNTGSSKKSDGSKNSEGDVDVELFSLQSFLTNLLATGQTNAVEMLFTPRQYWIDSSPEWEFILSNRRSLIHSGSCAFVGYCQKQAAKYCVKGQRVIAAQAIVKFLKEYKYRDIKLFSTDIVRFVDEMNTDEIQIVDHKLESGIIPHLQVCNRMCPLHFRVKDALDIYQRVVDTYGRRALATVTNEGVDWKSLMHALRIAQECEELLSTGFITLPRLNADFLKEIRLGQHSYESVQEMIDIQVGRVLLAEQNSKLQSSIDVLYWTQHVEKTYVDHIAKAYGFVAPRSTDLIVEPSLKQKTQLDAYVNNKVIW